MEYFLETVVPWVVLGVLWSFLFLFWAALWHGWTRSDTVEPYVEGGE